MKQKIEVSKEVRASIAETFKVTPQAVGQALQYKTNSVKAIRMRAMAMENGGKVWQESPQSAKPVKELDSHGNVKRTY